MAKKSEKGSSNLLPLYLGIVFLNAQTDLGVKILLQNTLFKVLEGSQLIFYTTILNLLILLPFIFFYLPAGWISTRFPRLKVVRWCATATIPIVAFIWGGLYFGDWRVATGGLFLLSLQSAIYSPAKYSLIKELFGEMGLIKINGWVQGITIGAILWGIFFYSLLFEKMAVEGEKIPPLLHSVAPIAGILLFTSLLEAGLAFQLEKKGKTQEKMGEEGETGEEGKGVEWRPIWEAMGGLALFWAVSQLVTAIFGEYLKTYLGITNSAIPQIVLGLSGIGLGVGAFVLGKIGEKWGIGAVPVGGGIMAGSLGLLPTTTSLWGVALLTFLYGVGGALFIVPLNAQIQKLTPNPLLGKVLAQTNFYQYLAMGGVLILGLGLSHWGINSPLLFYGAGGTVGGITLYYLIRYRRKFAMGLLKLPVPLLYRVGGRGMENFPQSGGVLLLGNHQSKVDWLLLQYLSPRPLRFVVDRSYWNRWYLRPFFAFFNVIPISTRGAKRGLDEVKRALQQGDWVCIFPEGHLTRNGHLSLFREGWRRGVAGVERVQIIPFGIYGLWGSRFSYAPFPFKKDKFVEITFGSPTSPTISGSPLRRRVFQLVGESYRRYFQKLSPSSHTSTSLQLSHFYPFTRGGVWGKPLSPVDEILEQWKRENIHLESLNSFGAIPTLKRIFRENMDFFLAPLPFYQKLLSSQFPPPILPSQWVKKLRYPIVVVTPGELKELPEIERKFQALFLKELYRWVVEDGKIVEITLPHQLMEDLLYHPKFWEGERGYPLWGNR